MNIAIFSQLDSFTTEFRRVGIKTTLTEMGVSLRKERAWSYQIFRGLRPKTPYYLSQLRSEHLITSLSVLRAAPAKESSSLSRWRKQGTAFQPLYQLKPSKCTHFHLKRSQMGGLGKEGRKAFGKH